MKKAICLLLMFLCFTAIAQTDVKPGVDRWKIKTSAATRKRPKNIALYKLLGFPLLDAEYNSDDYSTRLMPVPLEDNLKEGDMVTTTGYLHLVALERDPKKKRDGDYHIQLTLHPDWTDSCFIVEIPYERFMTAALKDSSVHARTFIRQRLLRGKQPGTGGNVMQHPVYVTVTGQLFYDAIHAKDMRSDDPSKNKYRGKSGGQDTPMHSYTAWELHPVTHIAFARRP